MATAIIMELCGGEASDISEAGQEPNWRRHATLRFERLMGLGGMAVAPHEAVARLEALGFTGIMQPLSTSCADHMGSTAARVQTWDGSKWSFTSDFIQADEQILKPMVKAGAEKYLSDKKLTRRTPADCQS
jgi:hypothetical protein